MASDKKRKEKWMEDKKNKKIDRFNVIVGHLVGLGIFILANILLYVSAHWYTNIVDYEIVYDSVIVRVETDVNTLETMAFGPEEVRFTSDEPRVERYRNLFADDSLLYLPRDEYNAYREMLFTNDFEQDER